MKHTNQIKELLSGVFAPLTTPFAADESLDTDGLKSNMQRYAQSPLKGYLALGSNGENKSLTFAEKKQILDIVCRYKGREQVVIVGCIAETTKETLAIAHQAEQCGADFIALLPPSYFKKQMSDAVLLRYFTDVADQVKIPCLLYCAPQYAAGLTLSANLVKEASAHDNIVGIKDSAGNIDNYLMNVPSDFAVMAGSATFFVSALCSGAVGGVLSMANAFPEFTNRLYQLFLAGQYQECFALNRDFLRLNQQLSGKGGVASVKAAMDYAGFVGGAPRLPLWPLSPQERQDLSLLLENSILSARY